MRLVWSPSNDPAVVVYNVYDTSLFFSPRLIKTVPAPASFTTIISLSSASLYTFRVRAADRNGKEDGNTIDISGIPYAGIISADVLSSSSARVHFNDGSNADEINISCKTPTDADFSLYKRVTNVTQTSTVLTGLVSGTTYTCRAALVIGSTVDNNSSTIAFTPIGQATQLVFTSQPGSASAGAPLPSQPVVAIQDANGNTITAGPDASAVVTLTLAVGSPTLGTIRGAASIAAVNGVATFSGINLQEAGAKILTATKEDTSAQTYGSASLTANSNSFTISPGSVSATASTIAVTPAGPLVANGSSSYTVTITLSDEYGNYINGVKPQFASSNLSDSILQPTLNTNTSGQTTGSIATTIAGTRSLSISSPAGLTSVTTAAVFTHGTATKVAFSRQPTNSPAGPGAMANVEVTIQDAQGNTVNTGPSSTADVTVSIFVNPGGGTLSGTTTMAAVNGVATFSGLGIDKTGTGYKLVGNSAPLAVAYSNAFNVTAGVPARIKITGPASVVSGQCSTGYTFQLQDFAGNPANATANTTINLGGLGAAALYTSSSCGSAPLSGTLTYTTGSNTRTLYLKNNKAQSLTLTATDPSNVMTQGTLPVGVAPSQMSMSAPATVVAGRCSAALNITTAGADGSAGPLVTDTTVTVTGLGLTQASVFSDAACTSALDPSNVVLTAGSTTTPVYFKDNKAETVSISVVDASGNISTSTAPQTITVKASRIEFATSVSSVVAGSCSPVFYVRLKDEANNLVTSSENVTLAINGLASTQGNFYTAANCTGPSIGSTVIVPQNMSTTNIYFKDNAAETLALSISDPANVLTTSQTINISVSPSSLRITGPTPASARTNVCAGPFTLNTMDGANAVTAAITPINVTLSGMGGAGAFYSDNACANSVSSFTFASGESSKTFYYMSYAPSPGSPFVLTASDQANVLASGTFNFTVTPAPAFIGTAPGTERWFQSGFTPAAARMDGPASAYSLAFDPSYANLYVVDLASHRVLKYDYTNGAYVGWIGGYTGAGNLGPTGSVVSSAMNAACIGLFPSKSGQATPGWCQGGQSFLWSHHTTGGHLADPYGIAVSPSYIYVANYNGQTISRFDAATGTFAGWIGRVANSGSPGYSVGSLQSAPDLSNSCATTTGGTNNTTSLGSPTPGWCVGGTSYNSNYIGVGNNAYLRGDGGLTYPRAITFANVGGTNFIYVATRGMILRYHADTGAFMGWVGWIQNTTPALSSAPDVSNTCGTTSSGNRTPGWCIGGYSQVVAPQSSPGGVSNDPMGVYADTSTGVLYVTYSDNNGTVARYDLATGAFVAPVLTNLGWNTPYQMTSDGANYYVADWRRVAKTDQNMTLYGWIGKVANATSMSGSPGCSSLVSNADTPGWCMGGTAKAGVNETAFHHLTAIAYDGNGHLITGQGSRYPGVKKWNATTGQYVGMLAFEADSPARWSADTTKVAGFWGYDDKAMASPGGVFTDTTNGIIYMTELMGGRIKKLSLATGELLGIIGGITTSPTGGMPGCVGANPMGPSPAWCLGALFNPNYLWNDAIPQQVNGIMRTPTGITSDGTYLYVADYELHRISRFDAATGAPAGWIGGINQTPTGGASGCSTAASGTFTPGWCTGGYSTAAAQYSGGAFFRYPTGVTYAAGKLYVVDRDSHRVTSYNATTGEFLGWIGAINTTTGMTGCTPVNNGSGYNVASGWCVGGTSRISVNADRGGGFYFATAREGITTDGSNLYISNSGNARIDKFDLNGVWQGSTYSRSDNNYSTTWTTNSTSLSNFWSGSAWCSYPNGLWTDGTHLYGTLTNHCSSTSAGATWKMNLSTGTMVGWRGGVRNQPTGGETNCDSTQPGQATPGWCQGGLADAGYTLGRFGTPYFISGDSNYIYVSDENTHRLTRLPK